MKPLRRRRNRYFWKNWQRRTFPKRKRLMLMQRNIVNGYLEKGPISASGNSVSRVCFSEASKNVLTLRTCLSSRGRSSVAFSWGTESWTLYGTCCWELLKWTCCVRMVRSCLFVLVRLSRYFSENSTRFSVILCNSSWVMARRISLLSTLRNSKLILWSSWRRDSRSWG